VIAAHEPKVQPGADFRRGTHASGRRALTGDSWRWFVNPGRTSGPEFATMTTTEPLAWGRDFWLKVTFLRKTV
jgi:hypothetical protein